MSELAKEHGIELLSREKFEEYDGIRLSGLINMLNYEAARDVTSLTREEWMHIMRNYLACAEAYKPRERVDYDD